MGNFAVTNGRATSTILTRRARMGWILGIGLVAVGASAYAGLKIADARRVARVAPGGANHGKVSRVLRSGADGAPGLAVVDDRGVRGVLAEGAEVGAGMRLATDERTRARVDFDDGSSMVLDRATTVAIAKDPRSLGLEDGALILDVSAPTGSSPYMVTTPVGGVRAVSAKLALTELPDRATLEVSRGEAEVADGSGSTLRVESGQEGTMLRNGRTELAPANDLAQRLSFGERLAMTPNHDEDGEAPLTGLGELRARRPGSKDDKEKALRLARHDVKVRIVGNFARTEIDETFANDTDQELEGLYRFPLPPDASIERLALDVDGKLVDGAFVDKDKGAAIWRGVIQHAAPQAPKPVDEIIWVPGPWRDPALLEWQRGGRTELKIFPIPKHGTRRVVVAYTESIAPVAGLRRYTYPLPQAAGSGLRIDSASFDVQVLGADAAMPVHVSGYELGAPSQETSGVRYAKNVADFVPAGDLGVEYALANASSDLTGWGYSDAASGDRYAVLALRPKLPSWSDARSRDQVNVVDVGRAMVGERLARAKRLAVELTQEMDRRDRVTVLACDVECRALPGGWTVPGSGAAHDVDAFLGTENANGASDLVGAMHAAARLEGRDAGHDLRVVLVSDGLATAGYRRLERVSTEVEDAVGDPRAEVVAVPIGADADTSMLAEVARGGGGVVVPYQPGERLETAAIDVLNATYGVTLRDASLTLPAGFEEQAPANLAPLRAGSETLVAVRMKDDQVGGEAVLRGKVAGEPFEAHYPLDLRAVAGGENGFVPRTFATLTIADKERTGGDASRGELVKLSQRYAVPSRFTSLLVLESEAMFHAFGVDHTAKAPLWTGESEAQATESENTSTSTPSGGAAPAKKSATRASVNFDPMDAMKDEAPTGGGSGGATGALASASPYAGPDLPRPAPSPPAPVSHAAQAAAPAATATAPFTAAAQPPPPPPWWMMERRRMIPMHRVWFRVAQIVTDDRPAVAPEKVAAARAALAAAPDERKTYADLARMLSENGDVDELGDVVDRWMARDPLDPDVLAARADVLERRGDRAGALRVLAGTAAAGEDAGVATSLAVAYERARRPEAACSLRVAAAELRPSDADAVAAAVACEKARGNSGAAERWLGGFSDKAKLATAVNRRGAGARPDNVRYGDVLVDATWDGGAGADLDVAVVDPAGVRASCASRARGLRALDCTSASHEALALSDPKAGPFVVEITRTGEGTRPVSGTVRVSSLGQNQTIGFTLRGARARVARVDVRFESRLDPLPGY